MKKEKRNLLHGARVYLSGPMDFVLSRTREKKYGWRNRLGQFLRHHGADVFDPWYKPLVKGIGPVGEEDERSIELRKRWTFSPNPGGAKARGYCESTFGNVLHIDLRMVDLSDFVIAYCPTNLYSVGTPHEIALARQQRKPVLMVSPPVQFAALAKLKKRAKKDASLSALVDRLERELPVKENPSGTPSLWYMALVGSENFFDGFGFDTYRKEFRWTKQGIDEQECGRRLVRPLLPFIESLARGDYPKRWLHHERQFVRDPDWLLLEVKSAGEQI